MIFLNKKYIDINCDVGEGIANEKDLFPFISSCNIACGGHAGDISSMRQVVELCKSYGIHAGAHPSYPDRKHFGRISIELSREVLIASIREQVSNLNAVLREAKVSLHHIKAHGALYNDIASDASLSLIFLEAIEEFRQSSKLFVPYNSVLERQGLEKGFRIVREAFADRNYDEELNLVSRKNAKALIEDPEAVLTHIVSMVQNNKVKTIEGKLYPMEPETICIHGDTPTALQILEYLSSELTNYNIYIKK